MNRFASGDFLPAFQADSSINPAFQFSTLGGHRLVLMFIGSAGSEAGRRLCDALFAEADWLANQKIPVYLVTADPQDRDTGRLAEIARRFTVFWDFDLAIHRLYGMSADLPGASARTLHLGAFVIRENLRLHALLPVSPAESLVRRLHDAVAALPPREAIRPMPAHAPVLLVPDVVDREFCRRLIAYYQENGGDESGFMRDVGGETRGILDPKMKRRRDCYIQDQALIDRIRSALQRRIVPEIRKAFGVRMTRVERYLIGCYDDTDKGFFRAHRDNVSKGTAHRQFAVSLNLNSEEYDGGALRFPEYGQNFYKPETGAAVVFSCSLLHEALPVTRGRRYVLLPFLYDEKAAALRAENRRFLANEPPIAVEDLAPA